jgi:hypothetical protein
MTGFFNDKADDQGDEGSDQEKTTGRPEVSRMIGCADQRFSIIGGKYWSQYGSNAEG